jgi:hypothetical protein
MFKYILVSGFNISNIICICLDGETDSETVQICLIISNSAKWTNVDFDSTTKHLVSLFIPSAFRPQLVKITLIH